MPMPVGLRARLSAMMFLQFFIWGAWYVTAPSYLTRVGFTGADIGTMYTLGPIAGMISPLLVGMVADRFFAARGRRARTAPPWRRRARAQWRPLRAAQRGHSRPS